MESDLQAIVERHFRVYDAGAEPMPGGAHARVFFLMFPEGELDARFAAAHKDILAEDPDAIVFLRREGGEDMLVVAPRAPVEKGSTRLNWILLAATMLTTLSAGALYWHFYVDPDATFGWQLWLNPVNLGWGFLTFTLPLMAILGVHESAHYIAARMHGLRASLPFFIPFPPVPLPFGTLGAFIRLKDPIPNRKALFDIGASGPLAGFVIAVPVILMGAWLTDDVGMAVPDPDRPLLDMDAPFVLDAGSPGKAGLVVAEPANRTLLLHITAPDSDGSWSYVLAAEALGPNATTDSWQAKLAPNETALHYIQVPNGTTSMRVDVSWDDGLIQCADPLLVKAFKPLFSNEAHLTHPTFFAGWVGLLITGINLLPAGQLDGGHVARAVFGERMKIVAYAAIGFLFYLAFEFQSWSLMALFIVLMGINHPPPLNERSELGTARKIIAVVVLIVLLLTFVPRPILG